VPEQVAEFAKNAHLKGIRVIIAGAGGAAHLPGVVAAFSLFLSLVYLAVLLFPLMDGIRYFLFTDASRNSVATVALDGGQNAGILAVQILAAAMRIC